MTRLFTGGWPEFIFHDKETSRYIGRVREVFRHLELVLLDDGEIVAAGWAVPLRWNGQIDDLPAGYNDSLARAVNGHDAGESPDTLAILAAQVRPDGRGKGVAGELLTALRHLADQAGWPRVICPVRPTLKARYPLTPIERYIEWTRPDGAPLDPWIRTHWRLGARVLAPAPRSQVIDGTVAEWQTWTGMAFPDSGDYVIPDGLSTLHIDREADQGVYIEPNVWLQHR
jgi:GNAT superfamily N-acetyltransferase